MSEQENNKWFKDNILAIVTLVISMMTIGYFGIVKGTSDTNRINALEVEMAKKDTQIQSLQDKKVDKEVFMLIQTSLSDIQNDIREIRTNQIVSKIKF